MDEMASEEPSQPLKIGVLLSGSGSNLQALIDANKDNTLHARIVLVISSRPDAYGLIRAEQAGIEYLSLDREWYEDSSAANKYIAEQFKAAGAEYIVMAGYMRKVTEEVLDAFPDRVINLHPALLPSFKGAHAIQEAFDSGVKITGITVHFANAEYDKGPIIAQVPVIIEEQDTLESLEARMHEVEHALYPQVIEMLAQGRVSIDEKRKVRIDGKKGA